MLKNILKNMYICNVDLANFANFTLQLRLFLLFIAGANPNY